MSDTDLQLLARYHRDHAEDAFAEIVRRHLDLVFSAALRQVGSPQLAEEVAQAVFVDLSRDTCKLKPDTILTAWLYSVTRRTAIDVVRQESRRQLREQVASEMNAMNATASDWTRIEPLLDEAMSALDDTDRAAVLLRYFENKSLREVGARLGTSDDAAQKRVSRAVEQLREFFTKRGVTVGTGALAVVLSANAIQGAPVGLAITISTAAVLAGTAMHTPAVIAATKTIAMTALQKTFIAATLTAAIGTGIYEAHQAARLQNQNQGFRKQQAPLAEQLRQLQQQRDDANIQLAALRTENEQLKSNSHESELLKLRAEAARSRNAAEIENDPAFQKARLWIAKENTIRRQFEQHPDQWIPEMKFLSSEDWLDQARKADLETTTGMRLALCNVRGAASFSFAGKISQALRVYLDAHNQQLPDSTAPLSEYFKPPVEDAAAILSRYEMLSSEEQTNPKYLGASIIQKVSVDHVDNVILISPHSVNSISPSGWPAVMPEELEPVLKSYFKANNNENCLTLYDLEPYVTTPAQKETLTKLIKAVTR